MQVVERHIQTKGRQQAFFGLPVSAGFMSPFQIGRDNRITETTMKAIVTSVIAGSTPQAQVLLWDGSGNYLGDYTESLTFQSTDKTSADYLSDIKTGVIAGILSDTGTTLLTTEITILDSILSLRTESALSISLQTSTGAVGTQISTTQDSLVFVDGSVTTTSTIAGASAGDIIVEVAPTNSATASDWVEKGRIGTSQTYTLAIALQGVSVQKSQVVAYVPVGYYVKARTSGSGTVSYALTSVRQLAL